MGDTDSTIVHSSHSLHLLAPGLRLALGSRSEAGSREDSLLLDLAWWAAALWVFQYLLVEVSRRDLQVHMGGGMPGGARRYFLRGWRWAAPRLLLAAHW